MCICIFEFNNITNITTYIETAVKEAADRWFSQKKDFVEPKLWWAARWFLFWY